MLEVGLQAVDGNNNLAGGGAAAENFSEIRVVSLSPASPMMVTWQVALGGGGIFGGACKCRIPRVTSDASVENTSDGQRG